MSDIGVFDPLNFSCPHCQAPPGQGCRTSRGDEPYRRGPERPAHALRVKRADTVRRGQSVTP